MMILAFTGKACSILFFFSAWWFYIPPKQQQEKQQDQLEIKPNNVVLGNGNVVNHVVHPSIDSINNKRY